MHRSWPPILALWLLGILAAAQFAKMSVIAPILRTDFGLSLPQLGWLISLMEVGGAVFGLVSGLALARFGMRGFLLWGLAILSAASLMQAFAATPFLLFAARAIEGIGYVLVVIAAPTAIAATADNRLRPRALALWSTFVPVGIAVGGAITGLAVGMMGMSGVMLLWAATIAAAVPVAMRLPLADIPPARIRFPATAAWISTFGFGLYTVFISAVTMLLPSFLIERCGATMGEAALVAGVASLAVLPGAGAAMWLMRDGDIGMRRTLLFSTIALAPSVPLLLLLYGDASSALPRIGTIAVLAVAVSGLVPPLVFARLPLLAGASSPEDPRIATTNGLVTQFGAGGALVGPPAGGIIVSLWGWQGLGAAAGALVIALLAAIVASEYAGRTSRNTASASTARAE